MGNRTRLNLLSIILYVTLIWDVYSQKLESGFTNEEKQKLLDIHNWYRANVALGINPFVPTASNMIALEWDDRLSLTAQTWADNCTGWYDTNKERRTKPFTNVGQNYAGNYGIEKAVKLWFNEGQWYEYNSTTLGECMGAACNQYLQLIWSTSSKVGCGWNKCSERAISSLICNYAPGGHTGYTGNGDPPYEEGEACSNCPTGYPYCLGNGLCATKRAVEKSESVSECKSRPCLNGAVFDDKTCSCQCNPDTEGAVCEAPCEDTIDRCDTWKEDQCKWDAQLYTYMSVHCRKTCQMCGRNSDTALINEDGIITNLKRTDKTGDVDFKNNIVNEVDSCANRFPNGMCGKWAKRDLCSRAKIFMNFHCPKECKTCKLIHEPTVITQYGDCKNLHDNNRQCEEWGYYGHCDRSPTWMRIYCAKTCNSCNTFKVGPCDNKHDNDAHCNAWAMRGDCETSEYWMKTFCSSACDSCGWIPGPEPGKEIIQNMP